MFVFGDPVFGFLSLTFYHFAVVTVDVLAYNRDLHKPQQFDFGVAGKFDQKIIALVNEKSTPTWCANTCGEKLNGVDMLFFIAGKANNSFMLATPSGGRTIMEAPTTWLSLTLQEGNKNKN